MALTFSQGGVYGVTLLGRWDDAVETRNVFQFEKSDAGTITQAQGLDDIEDILDFLLNILTAVQHIVQIYRGFEVYRLEGPPAVASRMFGTPWAGINSATDPLPPGVAFLTYWNTGVPNRQLRKYFSGFYETSINDEGNFNGVTTSALGTLAGAMLNPFTETNGTWTFGGYQTGEVGSFVPVTSAVASANPSYQRRRRRGRGI